MQTTVHFSGLVILIIAELGLRCLTQVLSTSASGCVDKRLPAVESSGAATAASESATVTATTIVG